MSQKKYSVVMTQDEVDALYKLCNFIGGNQTGTARMLFTGNSQGDGFRSKLRPFVSKNADRTIGNPYGSVDFPVTDHMRNFYNHNY